MEEKLLKVCLASSTGGHFSELQQLVKKVDKYDFFIVTERNETAESLQERYQVDFLLQQERKDASFLFTFLRNVMKSWSALRKRKPDVIISTGAGATVPICLLAKLLNIKVIYIESFAKITSPTLTGRILYRFADKFYIQWEQMKKHYPKAEYRGKIY